MGDIIDLIRVNDYCAGLGLSTLHPLVSVVDLSEGRWPSQSGTKAIRYHFYGVFLQYSQIWPSEL